MLWTFGKISLSLYLSHSHCCSISLSLSFSFYLLLCHSNNSKAENKGYQAACYGDLSKLIATSLPISRTSPCHREFLCHFSMSIWLHFCAPPSLVLYFPACLIMWFNLCNLRHCHLSYTLTLSLSGMSEYMTAY